MPMERSCLTNSPTGLRMALANSRTDTPAGTVMSPNSSTSGSGGSGGAGAEGSSWSSSGSSAGSSGRRMERSASASPGSRPDDAVVTGKPSSRAVARTSLDASPSSLASSWILLVTMRTLTASFAPPDGYRGAADREASAPASGGGRSNRS